MKKIIFIIFITVIIVIFSGRFVSAQGEVPFGTSQEATPSAEATAASDAASASATIRHSGEVDASTDSRISQQGGDSGRASLARMTEGEPPLLVLSPISPPSVALDIAGLSSANGSAHVKNRSHVRKLVKKSYKAMESVTVQVEDEDKEKIRLDVFDPKGSHILLKVQTSSQDNLTTYKILPPVQFRPGRYKVVVTDSFGKVSTQDFAWGVLAVNTYKSIYLPNEKVKFAMAVLDEAGNTVCDASVKLRITSPVIARSVSDEAISGIASGSASPRNDETFLSTEDHTIIINKEQCNIKDVNYKQDYESEYNDASEIGTYNYTLSAKTKNGDFSVDDSFEVRESVPFDIERDTATRIYPVKNYPVKFHITANENFDGTIYEVVPKSFEVYPLDTYCHPETSSVIASDSEAISTPSAGIASSSAERTPRNDRRERGRNDKECAGALSYERVKTVDSKLLTLDEKEAPIPHLGMPFASKGETLQSDVSLRAERSNLNDRSGQAPQFPLTLGFGDQLEDKDQKELYHKFGMIGHDGLDFAVPLYTPILAVDDGRVVFTDNLYGKTVVILHSWGQSYYGHLSSYNVKNGDGVKRGEVIGYSGNTGISTGPHLHFGIRANVYDKKNGFFGKINPLSYLGLSDPARVAVGTIDQFEAKVIYWHLKVSKGDKITLGYSYNSPDISPQFYLLGPLTLSSTNTNTNNHQKTRLSADSLTEYNANAQRPGLSKNTLSQNTENVNTENVKSVDQAGIEPANSDSSDLNVHQHLAHTKSITDYTPVFQENVSGASCLSGPSCPLSGTFVFAEARQWQVASDAPGQTTIEQQINIIDKAMTIGGVRSGAVLIDVDKYSADTYYFEVVAKVTSGSGTAVLTYNAGTGSAPSGGSTLTISNINSTNYARYRSASFTPANSGGLGQNAYISSLTGTGTTLEAARIIIIQSDPSKLTNTQTQIEVGNRERTTATVMTTLTNPKYFKYDDSKYDGTKTASFEATLVSGAAQSTEGPTVPGTSADGAEVGSIAWTSPTVVANIQTDDTSYIVATLTDDGTIGEESHYLKATNYGFATIPNDDTQVEGVAVEVIRNAGNVSTMKDCSIRLINSAGTVAGDEKNSGQDCKTTKHSDAAFWGTADATVTYGSSTDTWGLTLTGQDVRNSNFGVAFSVVKDTTAGVGRAANMDRVRITVYWQGGAAETATAELYNRTLGATVTGSTITLTSTTPSRVRSGPLTTNWDTTSADTYEVRWKTTAQTPTLSNAKIIIDQTSTSTGISKLETYHEYINTNVNTGYANIGTFSTTAQGQLPQILQQPTTITSTIGGTNYVYVLGGLPTLNPVSTVYKASIDSSANIGTFSTTSQAQLPQILYEHTTISLAIGGTNYVYVLGGCNGGTCGFVSAVYKASIDPSTANIAAFATTSQAQLPQVFSNHTTITSTIGGTNYVYVLGGQNSGSVMLSTVYKSTIDSSANLGTFATTSQSQLPQILENHTTITSTIGGTNYVYVLGGGNVSVSLSTVYKASLDSSANLGTFATTSQSQLPEQLQLHTTITSTIGGTNYVYVLGGNSAVYKASLDSSANIQAFATTSQSQLPQILNSLNTMALTINTANYVYVLGGRNVSANQSTVYKSQIDPFVGSGFPNLYDSGSWTGGTFSYFHEATIRGVGGFAGSARLTPGALGTVTSDITNIGTFATTSQAQLPQILSDHTSITLSLGGINYVYVLGGSASANGFQSTVYKATIDSSANIGAIVTTSQAQLPQIRARHTTIISTIGGTNYVYVLGGGNLGNNPQSTVYKASIDSSANINTFATTSQGQLPQILDRHTTITSTIGGTNYVYVLGGCGATGNCGAVVSTVYKASIDSSANIAAFATTSQAQLPQVLQNHTTITSTIGGTNYIYVLGGETVGGVRSTVYKASIDSSANINTFATTSQAQLREILREHTSITSTIGGTNYVYVLGGTASGTDQSTVYKASIDASNANIGTFATTSQAQLPQTLYDHATILSTIGGINYVYVLGSSTGAVQSTVYKSAVGNSYELLRSSAVSLITASDIPTFSSTSQSQLPQILAQQTTIASTIGGTNYVYVLGGCNSLCGAGTTQSTVYKASIDASSNIQAFATTSQSQLPQILRNLTSITQTIGGTNYVYVLGGFNASVAQSTVYKASIDSSANIGTFATTSQAQLPQIINAHTSITSTIGGTNYVYVLGGCDANIFCSIGGSIKSTVYKASIDSSANIGTFATTSQSQLPKEFQSPTSITQTIAGTNYVYVLGGYDGVTGRSTVYKASIDSSANIGTFATTSQAQLPNGLDFHTTITSTIGGTNYVYVLGGCGSLCSDSRSTVYKASIDSSANIGTFATTSQSQLPQIIGQLTTMVSTIAGTNYVYVLGGYDGLVTKSTVYKAQLGGQEYDTEAQTADVNSSWLVITATNLPTVASGPTLDQLMRHGKWFSGGAEQAFTF